MQRRVSSRSTRASRTRRVSGLAFEVTTTRRILFRTSTGIPVRRKNTIASPPTIRPVPFVSASRKYASTASTVNPSTTAYV